MSRFPIFVLGVIAVGLAAMQVTSMCGTRKPENLAAGPIEPNHLDLTSDHGQFVVSGVASRDRDAQQATAAPHELTFRRDAAVKQANYAEHNRFDPTLHHAKVVDMGTTGTVHNIQHAPAVPREFTFQPNGHIQRSSHIEPKLLAPSSNYGHDTGVSGGEAIAHDWSLRRPSASMSDDARKRNARRLPTPRSAIRMAMFQETDNPNGTSAPQITVSSPTKTVEVERETPISGISVTDTDEADTLTTQLQVGSGKLTVTEQSGATVAGNKSKTLEITGTADVITTVLGTLRYTSDAGVAADTLTIKASDRSAKAQDQTVEITIKSATNIKLINVSVGNYIWRTEPRREVRANSKVMKLVFQGVDNGLFNLAIQRDKADGTRDFLNATRTGFGTGRAPHAGSEIEIDLNAVAESKYTLTPIVVAANNVNDTRHRLLPVVIHTPDTNLAPPVPTSAYRNAYKDDGDFETEAAENKEDAPLAVYGQYIRIKGELDATDAGLRFEVFKIEGSKIIFVDTVARADVARKAWDVKLNLPFLTTGSTGLVVPYSLKSDRHNYAANPIYFSVIRTERFSDAPKIASIKLTPSNATELLKSNRIARINATTFTIAGTAVSAAAAQKDACIVLFQVVNGREINLKDIGGIATINGQGAWSANVTLEDPGDYEIRAKIAVGDLLSDPSETVTVKSRVTGPRRIGVNPTNLLFGPGRITLKVFFNKENLLDKNSAETLDKTTYEIKRPSDAAQAGKPPIIKPVFDASDNSVLLTFEDVGDDDGRYEIVITPDLVDVFGLKLNQTLEKTNGENETINIIRSSTAGLPTISAGVTNKTGDYVDFPEFTPPRDVPDGFNPSDKVETRVARLYYYRDAHRVAQIINRKVESYNRQAVDVQRQLADEARRDANAKTRARQQAERAAIQIAQKTRQKERELATAEQSLARTVQDLRNADEAQAGDIRTTAESLSQTIDTLRDDIEKSRENEAELNDRVQVLEAEERELREDQFRREVAAARADPDTYVPGKITSRDAVEQVSVSVIGEGLIHLRGPIKGINVIRRMINQIDAPVGQVRIGIHTVQINGEKGDKMEDVAERVQTYLDHSRFVTMQSTEMLRKAIVRVASQKAQEAWSGGRGQQDRDRRYLYNFFGEDFIDELAAMDSEFLHTGNKLLSLHSMKTTSLASALGVLALAKNTTRHEILMQFQQMMQCELPRAEQEYFNASLVTCRKEKCSHARCKQTHYVPFAHNAKFESLRGFFDAQVSGDDTMTPMQREVIRLAQIFKARLITEMELKQRVMERGLIEERLGNRLEELREARRLEDKAKLVVRRANRDAQQKKKDLVVYFTRLVGEVEESYRAARETLNDIGPALRFAREVEEISKAKQKNDGRLEIAGTKICFEICGDNVKVTNYVLPDGDKKTGDEAQKFAENRFKHRVNQLAGLLIRGELDEYRYEEYLSEYVDARKMVRGLQDQLEPDPNITVTTYITLERLNTFNSVAKTCDDILKVVSERARSLRTETNQLLSNLAARDADVSKQYEKWIAFRNMIESVLYEGHEATSAKKAILDEVDAAFKSLLQAEVDVNFAKAEAEKARRPLDHKKFLDMLIDDMEDKEAELLEGTRAHIANIDNYIKRVATALENDFNTQFYFPAFRCVRQASRHWDVQFGQTETTTILANNREFAKVSPAATMEFDLPERDILITEAMNGAKAMVDEYGALVNDPSFLALSKLGAGQSPATPSPGSTGGASTVRNVLPGLDGSTQEQVLAQNGPGRSQFGAALENLIPDPAIYKFETGTGFEIRPVIQPDGQAVVFDFHYMYTTRVREPVRPDEKHLGRVKRHFIDTDVQLGNYELRPVSRYQVALKAARTARGVPLLEDIPGLGTLFRPLPSQESSLQQNLILAQATIYPTVFDLMGLRWASAVADLDPLRVSNAEFLVRSRHRHLQNRVYDYSSSQVDEFLRTPDSRRRPDLYRTQETIPSVHPNGYGGPGLDLEDSTLQEGPFEPGTTWGGQKFVPSFSPEGAPVRPRRYPTPPTSTEFYQGDTYESGPIEFDSGTIEGMHPGILPSPTINPPTAAPDMETIMDAGPTLGAPRPVAQRVPQADPIPSSQRTSQRASQPQPNPKTQSRSQRIQQPVRRVSHTVPTQRPRQASQRRPQPRWKQTTQSTSQRTQQSVARRMAQAVSTAQATPTQRAQQTAQPASKPAPQRGSLLHRMTKIEGSGSFQ